jgi:MYXO-CTERM domain-containing protein
MDASAGLIALAVLVALLCLRRRRVPGDLTSLTNQTDLRREQNAVMMNLELERKP